MRNVFFVLLIGVGALSGCVPPSGAPGATGTDSNTNSQTLSARDYTAADLAIATANRVLSAKFTAYKFADNSVWVLEKISGTLYRLTGVTYEEIQINNASAFFLNNVAHQLSRLDLMNPRFQLFGVNNLLVLTDNTKISTAAWSSLNGSGSPFRFLGFNQVGASTPTPAQSFLFLSTSATGLIAALAGPDGGKRVELFQEHGQQYDCQIANPFDIAGGTSGGVIQFVDSTLYQIQIGNSPNCALPGVEGCGDALVEVRFNTAGNCVSRTVISQLNNISKFTSTNTIQARVDYTLNVADRYVLHPSGFLHSYDNGMGSVAMTWTDLDLSNVPINSAASVAINGNKVYWSAGGKNFSQALVAGSIPVVLP